MADLAYAQVGTLMSDKFSGAIWQWSLADSVIETGLVGDQRL
jgi:hypothetical protein